MNMTRSLQRSINTMINQAVDNAPYDKTRVGTILKRNDDNTYTIKVDGVIYYKIPAMNEFRADIGDIVKVVIPTNNPSQMFISTVRYTTETTLIGEIKMYAGNDEPTGWFKCDGRAVSRTTYSALFNVIGTTYGTGNGSTTFNLPDMRDRFPVGAGAAYALNGKGGSEYIQAHSHSFTNPTVDNGGGASITGGSHNHATYRKKNAGSGSAIYVPDGGSTSNGISTTGTTHTHSLPNHTHRVQNGAVNAVKDVPAGNGGNLPPYIGLNFLIYHGQH